jgi:signal transduction histidine kinase
MTDAVRGLSGSHGSGVFAATREARDPPLDGAVGASAGPDSATPPRSIEPTRVLLVDDDRMLLHVLEDVISRRLESVVVEACASPVDALAAIEARSFDVVVSDLVMGGLHGLDLLKRVKALRPSSLVVLITGAADRDLSVRALRGGAYDFIQKPVDADYLVACIRRAIETRRLRSEVERQEAELRRHADELERTVAERTDELRRASQAKDEFLATISHELRTPLTAILGWARLLCGGKLAVAEQRQAIESIARNARSQAQLIDDLLDVSRIITGKMRLDIVDVDLASVIDAAGSAIAPAAKAKGVAVEAHVDVPERVSGDAGRLQQVLWNLLSNAVKFTPRGGRITVRAEVNGDRVELEVSDDGAGIEFDLLPYVFDRFRQGDSQISSRRGLGLGLAIARHLVDLHGGTISVESEGPGRGATFRVVLPRPPAAIGPKKRGPLASASAGFANGDECLLGVRVLVVDDDNDTRDVLKLMLTQAGATVELASSASEARLAFARARPQVLLCDIGLGKEDGYSLLASLREDGSAGRHALHAVALTAHARSEDRAQALAAGFEMHLAKPGPPDLPRILAARLLGEPPNCS